jgi:hypothetical protein
MHNPDSSHQKHVTGEGNVKLLDSIDPGAGFGVVFQLLSGF